MHLPGIDEKPLRAKCDTGASVSALHAEVIETVTRGELTMVHFKVTPESDMVELRQVELQTVRSSNGETQSRPLVLLPVRLAGITFAIECTLTDRAPMAYPMLLGRNALAGRFLVDPAESRLHRKPRAGR